MSKSLKILTIAVALVMVTVPAFAQVISGSLTGVVKDNKGAILQRVSLKIISLSTGREYTSTCNDAGRFVFPYLAVGDYKLSVSKEAYHDYVIEQLNISLGAKDFLTVVLNPVTEFKKTIVVTPEQPLIEVSKPTSDTIIDNDVIDNLPVMERDFFDLLLTLNNVNKMEGMLSSNNEPGLSISGGRVRDNIFQVDGADSNATFNGQRQQFYSLDVIDQIQISTATYSAEYGRGAGGIINVLTKSGTDRYSGRVSYYLRDDSLDQNTEYDWKYQDIGVMLGGPLIKKKLYFLVSYNYITRHDSRDFILDYFVGEQLQVENKKTQNALFTKFNWYPNVNHEVTTTINYEPSELVQPMTNSLRPDRDGYTDEQGGISFTAADHWTISDNMLIDSYINFKRIVFDRKRNTPEDPPISDVWYVPSESGSGSIATYVGPNRGDSTNKELGFTLTEKFLYLPGETSWGTHTLAIGGDIGYTSIDCFEELLINYYNTRGVLPPNTSRYYMSEKFGDPNFDYSQVVFGTYLQDDIRLSQRLTLNVGLRLDHNSFLENTVFSPRFGFAYDPIGDQKTVIRGGAGIYYTKNFFQYQRYVNQPNTRTYYYDFENPREVSYEYVIADDINTPRTWEVSAGIERLLTEGITVSATAMYKKSDDQFFKYYTNLLDADTGLRENPNVNHNLIQFNNLGWNEYKGLSFEFNKRYNRRWMFRANYTWSKSWGNSSRYFGYGGSSLMYATQQNQDSWINGEGVTDMDLPHQLKLTTIVRLPFDFMLSGYYLYRSGGPITVQEDLTGVNGVPIPINTERLPNFKKLDIRLQKTISFGTHRKLHIYFDMINALNNRNVVYLQRYANILGRPNENYLVPNESSYDKERESQIGIKFDF